GIHESEELVGSHFGGHEEQAAVGINNQRFGFFGDGFFFGRLRANHNANADAQALAAAAVFRAIVVPGGRGHSFNVTIRQRRLNGAQKTCARKLTGRAAKKTGPEPRRLRAIR
ncbi:MAG TPA: hypothetical protein VEF54_00545, partial [archaeon]|nr:hypothetical protein [archaeon]